MSKVIIILLGTVIAWTGLAQSVMPVKQVITSFETEILLPDVETVSAVADSVITIDSRVRLQRLLGYGANLTESSVINLLRLDADTRMRVLEKLFSKSTGFGLDVLRVPIGATDFIDATHGNYTYNDTPNNMPDPDFEHFKMHRDRNLLKMLKTIQSINPRLKVILTPWSAPAWMKESQELTGMKGQNTLSEKYYLAFARYLARVLQEYKNSGIRVDSITMQNEPAFADAKYPSMGMNSAQQAHLIGVVSPEIRKIDPRVKLLILDHNWDMEKDVDDIIAQTKSQNDFDGIAYHCYGGDVGSIYRTHQKYKNKLIYQTECTGTNAPQPGDLEWWINTQVTSSAKLGASVSLGWNLALDEKGGPTNKGCGICRGMITINSQTHEVTINPELKALGISSRFLTGGAVVIQSKTSDPDLHEMAYVNKDGSRVVVIYNKTELEKVIQVVDEQNKSVAIRLAGKTATGFIW